jgi:hypothetical protein
VHGDRVLCGDDPDLTQRAMPGEQRAQLAGTPGQHDGYAMVPGCSDGSGDDLGWRMITAHGIHRYGTGSGGVRHAVSLSPLAAPGVTGTAAGRAGVTGDYIEIPICYSTYIAGKP